MNFLPQTTTSIIICRAQSGLRIIPLKAKKKVFPSSRADLSLSPPKIRYVQNLEQCVMQKNLTGVKWTILSRIPMYCR